MLEWFENIFVFSAVLALLSLFVLYLIALSTYHLGKSQSTQKEVTALSGYQYGAFISILLIVVLGIAMYLWWLNSIEYYVVMIIVIVLLSFFILYLKRQLTEINNRG